MAPLWLVTRGAARRRWAGLVGLALLVALVGSVSLAAVAGARRTSSAVDRFRTATDARDGGAVDFLLGGPDIGDDIAGALERLDGVEQTGTVRFFPTDALFDIDVTVAAPADTVAARSIDRPLVLDGRLPDPDAPDEAVVDEHAVSRLGLHTGDRFRAGTFSPEDCEALVGDDFQGFNGPALDLRIVGEVRRIEELQGDETDAAPALITTPAFARAHARDTCSTGVEVVARYAPGGGPSDDELTAALRSVVPGGAGLLASSIDDEFLDTVRSAVQVAVVALIAFALVTTAAGTLAVVQAVIRQVDGADEPALEAIGLTRRQRAVAMTLPVAAAGAVGAVVAVAGAVALSPLFPLGVARRAEPHPGRQFDGLAVGVGALLLVGLVVATGYLASRRAARRADAGDRVSGLPAIAARLGAPPAALIGLRLATDRTHGRAAVRTAVIGAGLAVAGVCGVAVLASSLSGVLDRPDRYGWVWTSKPDVEGEDAEATARAVAAEDRVQAAGHLVEASVEVNGDGADGFALDPLAGTLDFHVLEGRLPAADGEVALGHDVATAAHLGDTVTVSGSGPTDRELTVVGRAVLPQFDRSGGTSALMSTDVLTEVAPDAENSLVLRYRPGVDVDALEAYLGDAYGLSFPTYARPHPPGRLTHLDELRGLLIALAAFFAVLGVGGLAHALVVSSRRNRGHFATLRAVGLRRAQVVRSVLTCSLAIVGVAVLIGVPVGVAVGRGSWLLAVEGLGILDTPSVSATDVALVAALSLTVALAVGLLPAWRAGSRRPAQVLRSE